MGWLQAELDQFDIGTRLTDVPANVEVIPGPRTQREVLFGNPSSSSCQSELVSPFRLRPTQSHNQLTSAVLLFFRESVFNGYTVKLLRRCT